VQLVPDRFHVQAKQPGRFGFVVSGPFQRFQDQLLLSVLERGCADLEDEVSGSR